MTRQTGLFRAAFLSYASSSFQMDNSSSKINNKVMIGNHKPPSTACHMPDSLPSSLHTFFSFNSHNNPMNKHYFCPHFIDR